MFFLSLICCVVEGEGLLVLGNISLGGLLGMEILDIF